VLVVNDVVNVMAAYQPVVSSLQYTVRYCVPCTARLHNRLVCRHNMDHVINEHSRIIIVVLAKHEIAP
jgi:hypothetical protein